jgi:geranylgeranyl diphosphate synthase type II
MENGGKRMRPLLVLLGCKLFTENVSQALHPALGMELFHNFSLIHDDIMDQAPVRRGRPAVYRKWNTNVAILSGDAMIIKAYEELLKTDSSVALQVIQLFNKTAIEVCEGQQFDMDFELRDDVTIDEYLNMIRLKTAVLLAACLKIGAIIGGASENQAQLLYDFGINSGIAFQLQDDILDAYGESAKVGKQQGGDIIANKKTFLLLKAQELASENEHTELTNWLTGTHKNLDKVNGVLELFRKLNVKELAEREMWQFFNNGLASLDKVEGNEEWKQVLKQFSTQLMHREH